MKQLVKYSTVQKLYNCLLVAVNSKINKKQMKNNQMNRSLLQ